MAIVRRIGIDGKPNYQVRIATLDPLTGKRRNLTVGTYQNKREAEKEERAAKTQKDRGTLLVPDKVTVSELCMHWLDTKAGTITSNSLADYALVIRKHIIPALGAIKVQNLTPARIQAQYAAWRDAGMSPRMVRGCHMRLSQALGYATKMGIASRNVCDSVTAPRLQERKFDHWNPDEVRRFMVSADGDWLSPLWHLLVFEGMRRGEALGLRWTDLNWTTDDRGAQVTAHISQTVAPDKAGKGGAIIQQRTKTRTGSRSVRLSPDSAAALRAHRETWLLRRLASSSWSDHDLIVCTANGGPINPNNVTRSFNAIVGRAGLRRIKVHELRHTSATLMLLANVPAKVVSERLGHSSIAITLDLYSHVLPDMQEHAATEISRIVGLRTEAGGQ